MTDTPPTNLTCTTQLLPQWSDTTRRLLREGGVHAWNVLDGVASVHCIQAEINKACLGDRLSPARTTGDINSGSTNGSTSSSSRGDETFFLDRATRATPAFARHFPALHHLIQTLQFTLQTQLPSQPQQQQVQQQQQQQQTNNTTGILQWNMELTSVQLAEYPGDGRAAYPRHLDVSTTTTNTTNTTNNKHSEENAPQRIITAVYYLTPDDWNAELDQGALRLFHTAANTTDVIPYPGRLVVFRSNAVEHQVLPSLRRPRRALTMWFYGTTTSSTTTTTTITPTLPPPLSATPLSSQTTDIFSQQKDNETIHSVDDDIHNDQDKRTPPLVLPTREKCTSEPTPPPPLQIPANASEQPQDSTSTIFVAIASLRDSETGPTLRNLMETARYPRHISIGLVLQIDQQQDQETVLAPLPTEQDWWSSRVRVLQLAAQHATGPCPARAMCQLLHRTEHYVLQIDAHMRFRTNWDVYLIAQLQQRINDTGNPKCMLTTYPVGYQLPNQIPNETRGTRLVPWKFDRDGMLRQKAEFLEKHGSKGRDACGLYAAGFNFGPARVLQDCPYDGTLHHLFFGEELTMAVRLFGAGYDLYPPEESVCYHLWSRAHRPAVTSLESDQAKELRKVSMERVKEHLKNHIGTERSAKAFAEKIGVCFLTKTIRVHADRDNKKPTLANLDPESKALILKFMSNEFN